MPRTASALTSPAVRRLARRWAVLSIVAVLLASACKSKDYLYEETVPASELAESGGHGAYVPFAQTSDPRVHQGGHHEVAPAVAIGPEASTGHLLDPIVPIAASHSPLVQTGHGPAPYKPFWFSFERAEHPELAQSSSPAAGAGTAKASASPTPAPRYSLGARLGTPVPASGPTLSLPVGGDEPPTTVSGSIEKVLGRQVALRTASGSQLVVLPDTVRLERDRRGQVDDLRPGALVGVTQKPGGPASTVTLYSTGPSMPRPGVVPLDGARLGQVAVFGRIVSLQPGTLLVNSGTETTPIALPTSVEVLKPAQAGLADLKVGASLTATGSQGADGVLTAASARLTSEAPRAR